MVGEGGVERGRPAFGAPMTKNWGSGTVPPLY